LAATHTWAHPVVRNLVDEELALRRQLRETPEILTTEPRLSDEPPASEPPAPPTPQFKEPEGPVPTPPSGPSLGPAQRDPGLRHWSIPRTTAPAIEPVPIRAAARTDHPVEKLLAELFSPADHDKYLALQADYLAWVERGRSASRAERQAMGTLESAPRAAVALREPPHVTGRVGGGLLPGQVLFWGALAGLAGCLVGFGSGGGDGSATFSRVEDVTERLGLPVVATLPASDGPRAADESAAAPVTWAGLSVRAAELTLVVVMLLLAVGIVRSSDLAGQLAADPLAAIAEACAWWRR
jgi:hypothetical protein